MKTVFNTLAARLALCYAGIFVLFFSLAFIFCYGFINSVLYQQIDEDLEEDIVEFQTLLVAEGLDRVKAELDREMISDGAEGLFLRLWNEYGEIVFSSDVSAWQGIDLSQDQLEQAITEWESVFRTMRRDDHDYDHRMIYAPLSQNLLLQIGESMEEQQVFMQMLLYVFIATFCVVAVISGWVGWFMAKQALQGVNAVSRAAEAVANGSLDTKVLVKAQGSEIQCLVNTFNTMVERIHKLLSSMREMTDNIAHDMRSPLARIRANAELTLSSAQTIDEYKSWAIDTLEASDQLMQMINTTLDVAEAEAGSARLEKERINISAMVRDACELFESIAEDKCITLDLDLNSDCYVHGNLQYLQRMLANLLDNALKYTPVKGLVGIQTKLNDQHVAIVVSDNGIGISAWDQPKIYERFFRCDHSRSQKGFGLGLSFAYAVSKAHDGDLSVTSHLGQGSIFTITLPVCS